jgi:putative membrane protein
LDNTVSSAEALTFHFHWSVWVLLGSLLAGYLLAIRLGSRPAAVAAGPELDPDAPHVCFLAGVFALWLGADWPLHELAENYLYSAHMVQHMLFTFVAPPLLLMGIPAWLMRRVLSAVKLTAVIRLLTRPVVALIVFNLVVAVTHWPALVDGSLRSEPMHFSIHLVLVLSALLMWWPIVDPLPEMRRLSEPGKMLYLFLQSILPTVPASFLTFADGPIYRFYETVPRLWGIDVVTDQRIAGLIMKLGGGLLLWGVITVLFFKWNAREEAQEASDELSWDDFEHELDTWDLRK